MTDLLLFVAGCVCAGIGGDLFVEGLVGISERARLPKGIVAATIGAFATSTPELMVAVSSALKGVPQIAFGDAMGSNIVNIALVLAIPLAIFGLPAPRDSVFRDIPFALAIYPVIALAALGGRIDARDAILLLVVFGIWFGWLFRSARRQRSQIPQAPHGRRAAMLTAAALVGLAMLFLAGQLIVAGASGLAEAAGLPAFFIGATVVALGTSVPELATVVIATARGHQEVGLQTILGSNIFNSLLIVPVAALIHPITVMWSEVWPTMAFAFAATLLTVPVMGANLSRWRGTALMAVYAAYIAMQATVASA